MNALVAGARLVGVELDPVRQAAFQSYFSLLEERGRAVNLTSVRGWPEVREELLLRSLRVLAVEGSLLRRAVPEHGRGVRLLDVGSGAGVPGLVLKIALPSLDVVLLEATGKKCDFLREAASRLGLSGVRVVSVRAEEAGRDPAMRESFDVVVARALARLPELAELTLPFARRGGEVLAPKGAEAGDEIDSAAFAARELGAAPAQVSSIASPGTRGPDTIVLWRKERPTPSRYPRRPGVPHRQPLMAPGAATGRAGA